MLSSSIKAIDTAKIGRLCAKLVVPSRGSIIHVYFESFKWVLDSSEIIEWFGYLSLIFEIISFSDSISAYVKRSILEDFFSIDEILPKYDSWIAPAFLAKSMVNDKNSDLFFNLIYIL